MLRIGKLTDYATVVLASLAQEPDRHRAATELAERTRLSGPTVSKVAPGPSYPRNGVARAMLLPTVMAQMAS